jgi:Replication-relaxation
MNPKLTNRDVSLLLDVYTYRYLSVSQIERLHFPSKWMTYRRLQALTTLKCLKSFSPPNITERIFYLDREGAEIVAGELHVTVSDLQWYRYAKTPKDYFFIKHFLAINDFRILLTQASRISPMKLLGCIPEYVGQKTTQGNVKKYIRDNVCDIEDKAIHHSHTPDAVFALEKDGNAALFFAEIDRGTEIVSDPEKGFLKCIKFYLNYWVDGKYQRYQNEFDCKNFKTFRTLIITTSKTRLEHMREAVTKMPFADSYAKRFLWGTTEDQASVLTLFDPIWCSLDTADRTVYKIG